MGSGSLSLLPVPIHINHPIFQAICGWSFPDQFVKRILQNDIPQLIQLGNARMWAYVDPITMSIVGFGVLDVGTYYGQLTGNKPHPHIPLLGVNPESQGRGYGKSIVHHLIGEAALLACQPGTQCSDFVFLEVYTFSAKAIALYEKCGFVKVKDEPVFDPVEGNSYFILVKRVAISPET